MDNFVVMREDGSEIKCELVLSYTKNEKDYLLFTDNTYEDGKLKIYVYYEDGDSGDILPVLNEYEFNDAIRIYNEVRTGGSV